MESFKQYMDCRICKKHVLLPLTANQVSRMVNRGNECIQDVAPDVPSEWREFFIIGICPVCQEAIYG